MNLLPSVHDTRTGIVHTALHLGFFTYWLCSPKLRTSGIPSRETTTCPTCLEEARKIRYGHLTLVP